MKLILMGRVTLFASESIATDYHNNGMQNQKFLKITNIIISIGYFIIAHANALLSLNEFSNFHPQDPHHPATQTLLIHQLD